MIAILALLTLPLGYLVRNRLAALTVFGLAFAHVYTFQTANLVMEWVNGADAALPQNPSQQLLDGTLGYFGFTTGIAQSGSFSSPSGTICGPAATGAAWPPNSTPSADADLQCRVQVGRAPAVASQRSSR